MPARTRGRVTLNSSASRKHCCREMLSRSGVHAERGAARQTEFSTAFLKFLREARWMRPARQHKVVPIAQSQEGVHARITSVLGRHHLMHVPPQKVKQIERIHGVAVGRDARIELRR